MLKYSPFPIKLIIVMNIILMFFVNLDILSRILTIHRTAGEDGDDFFNSSLPFPSTSQVLRHYLIIFNKNISDLVGKRGRILGVFIFILNISFQNINYVFVKIVQCGTTISNSRTYRNSRVVYFWLNKKSRLR